MLVKVLRVLLLPSIALVSVVIWMFAFGIPLMNIAAGPATGTLLSVAVLAGYPARRGKQAQIVAFSLYAFSALFAASIVGGLFPWPYAGRSGLIVLFIGVHDEGLLGIGGLVLGGIVAAMAPRRRTAQQADEADDPAAGTP